MAKELWAEEQQIFSTTAASSQLAVQFHSEQVAFDDFSKVAYLIGDRIIYVLDLSPTRLPIKTTETPLGAISTGAALPVITTKELPATITDVQFCDKYVAVSAENVNGKTLPGQVLIYSRFLRSGGPDSFQQLASFTVGGWPQPLTSQSHSASQQEPCLLFV